MTGTKPAVDTGKQTALPDGLDAKGILELYERMFLLRRFELRAQEMNRKGMMPGFLHLYIGEEATGVGVCAHLRDSDWITSTHRGHGHALAKGVAPKLVMAELFGKATGVSLGRGGTMHLYDPEKGLFGTNGIVAGGIPLAVGVGISSRNRKSGQVGVAFFGDGASNHGSFHESLNFAGAQDAPVVFVCENNLYATATPLKIATKNCDIWKRAAGYGIHGEAVDGNDILAVWQAAKRAVERARSGGGPTLIESKTYRVVGHHEGDPVIGSYRTQEEVDSWKKRCPVANFRNRILESGWATEDQLQAIESRVDQTVKEAADFAINSPLPDPKTARDHVWAEPVNPQEVLSHKSSDQTVEQTWLEAVRDGIAEEMRRDANIMCMGEGIGERGGCFGHTKNLWHEFGDKRVIDTAICELAFTGSCIGAAATGCRAIADLMFSDFLFEAGSQIINQAAKLRYMTNGRISIPIVLRASMGTLKSSGAHHSGSYYPMWAHCPGLLVATPSTPADAKGLMKTALRMADPVIFLEHKALFATKGPVPVGEHLIPFGQAAVVRPGKDLTIVSCGLLIHRCLDAAKQLESMGVYCEVIDLRTIVPLDIDTIVASVAKTGHLLVVDEAFAMCGIGAEIAAAMMEHAFDELDAPVGRLHTDPVTFPFSPPLEEEVIVTVNKIMAAAQAVRAGQPIAPRRVKGASGKSASTFTVSTSAPAAQEVAAAAPTKPATDGAVAIIMPNQDLTITEATIVRWLKTVGDSVKAGQPVAEVETEKAVSEIESPADGVISEILASEGTVVKLGQEIGWLKPN